MTKSFVLPATAIAMAVIATNSLASQSLFGRAFDASLPALPSAHSASAKPSTVTPASPTYRLARRRLVSDCYRQRHREIRTFRDSELAGIQRAADRGASMVPNPDAFTRLPDGTDYGPLDHSIKLARLKAIARYEKFVADEANREVVDLAAIRMEEIRLDLDVEVARIRQMAVVEEVREGQILAARQRAIGLVETEITEARDRLKANVEEGRRRQGKLVEASRLALAGIEVELAAQVPKLPPYAIDTSVNDGLEAFRAGLLVSDPTD